MLQKLRYISALTATIFLLLSNSVFSQGVKLLSEEPTAFLVELGEFMKQASDKESRQAMQQFSARWNSGEYEPALQSKIISTFNTMMTQRMRPTPAFRDYLIAMNSFRPNTGTKAVLAWHKGLEPFLDGKSLRMLSTFLGNTVDLNQNKVLFRSYANSWQFRNGNFKIGRASWRGRVYI